MNKKFKNILKSVGISLISIAIFGIIGNYISMFVQWILSFNKVLINSAFAIIVILLIFLYFTFIVYNLKYKNKEDK